MGAIKLVVVLAVVAVFSFAIADLVVEPLQCNVDKKRIQSEARQMFSMGVGPAVAQRAHDNIRILRFCAERDPRDVDVYMTIAAEERVLGRFSDAELMYEQALRYDRRPEIYFNLGMVQLAQDHPEAVASFVRASSFDLNLVNHIPQPAIADAVVSAVQKLRARGIAEAKSK